MAAVQRTVSARISRYHYGLSLDIPFDENNVEHRCVDWRRRRWFDPQRQWTIDGAMNWFVHKVCMAFLVCFNLPMLMH